MINKLIARLGEPTKVRNNEHYWQCPECADTGKDNLMYNNKKGVFTCHANNNHSHKLYGELMKDENIKPFKPDNRIKPKEKESVKPPVMDVDYMLYCEYELMENKKAQEYMLKKWGLTHDTCSTMGIGIDPKKKAWVLPVFSKSGLLGYEYRDNTLKSGKEKKVWKENGTPCCLAEVNAINPETKYLIILEGFKDAYTYYQYLKEKDEQYLYHILTPSMGVDKIKKHINKINFAIYEKVYILVDNDTAGKNQIEELKKLCKFDFEVLELPCNCCEDFNEWYLKHKLNIAA